MQLQAGYILSGTEHALIKAGYDEAKIKGLLKSLSYFELNASQPLKTELNNPDPIIAVANNIISRGLPTLCPLFIEDEIIKQLNLGERVYNDLTGEINLQTNKHFHDIIQNIYDSLFTIDPRVSTNNVSSLDFDSWEEHQSDFEKQFFTSVAPDLFGEFIIQLLEPQRYFQSIINFSEEEKAKFESKLGSSAGDFFNQRVDFAIELPISSDKPKGLVIEIDGTQHNLSNQKKLDEKRDKAVKKAGWYDTIRILTNEISSPDKEKKDRIADFLVQPYVDTIKENYKNPIWNRENGKEAIIISLVPFAIARIQKTLVYLLLNGIIRLEDPEWKILIIEQDVPCAKLALQDFLNLMQNLLSLEDKGRKLPEIKLKTVPSKEFITFSFPISFEINEDTDFKPDIVLDISMLMKPGFKLNSGTNEYIKIQNYFHIRNSYSPKTERRILSSDAIKYDIKKDHQKDALIYFLGNIFRKASFRVGQVDILKKTLSLENVIALLPTGAGKSLCYQLSALLQPGIVLIVDPLKSLMKDQNDNLKKIWIDSTTFINSSIKKVAVRKQISEEMSRGLYQFTFISPERLQIDEFRKYLERMNETRISYLVVDEAHCVSEWGHDFRTPYLKLGENGRKYCKPNFEKLPIVGLTGTASFDVLADVQRELDIQEESSIISPDSYKRDELKFIPLEVEGNIQPTNNLNKFRKKVAELKYSKLVNLIKELSQNEWGNELVYENIDQFFNNYNEYPNSGIIFCPHVGGSFGVKKISGDLVSDFNLLQDKIGVYAGQLAADDQFDLEQIQEDFKNDKLSLLVATKAFGMGIDKPNIRFTIHFNMPQSIESYYQEAGRAGRDKQKAYCYIIYSPHIVRENVSVDREHMLSFHKNSFKGIDKEQKVLNELLRSVNYSYSYRINELTDLINENFDYVVKLKEWHGSYTNHWRIYINGENYPETFGYIDLNNLNRIINRRENPLNETEAATFINNIYDYLLEQKPDDQEFSDWITYKEERPNQDGLEIIREGLLPGEQASLSISFTNNAADLITESLAENDLAWDKETVLKAYPYTSTINDFKDNLKYRYKNKTGTEYNFNQSQTAVINEQYPRIRDEIDTFKAVYRLSLLGVIEKYDVDYRTKEINVHMVHQPNLYYKEKLVEYVGRYVSLEEKQVAADQIEEEEGDTILSKCSNYLINFVYEKIASKRLEAINVMESAILYGIDGGDFDEYVNTYFDSKYTSELRQFLQDNSVDFVWGFIERSEGAPDNINHLRGACDRLLVENPDNPGFLLLRSFAKLINPFYSKSEAIEDLNKAWELFKERLQWTRTEYLNNLSRYYSYILKYDSNIQIHLLDIILREHQKWLKEFNNKFLW